MRAIELRWGVPWYEAFGMTESGLDITRFARGARRVGR